MSSDPAVKAVRPAAVDGRVVFVNRFFHPDQSATSQMLTDLATGLAADGVTVSVITSRAAGPAALSAHETVSGVDVRRVAMSQFGRSRLLGRVVDYMTFLVGACRALIRHVKRGDVVVAMTDPPLLSVVAAPIARLKGAVLVNWVQDLYPDIALELGVGRTWARPLLSALARLRDRSFAAAATNVVIGTRMAERLRARMGAAVRIDVISNWANGAIVARSEGSRAEHRAALGIGDDAFVVAHAGNLGRAHDARTILDAIAWTEKADFGDAVTPTWLFIGGGAGYTWLRDEVHARGLKTARFLPHVPRERLGDTLRAADVHLVSLLPEMEGLLVPSKYYGILAAGRPVVLIGDRNGELAGLIERDGCGSVVAPGCAERLGQELLALSLDASHRHALGQAARAAFEARYDLSHAIEAWRRLVADVRQDIRQPVREGAARRQAGLT